jgi:hypothetical protein
MSKDITHKIQLNPVIKTSVYAKPRLQRNSVLPIKRSNVYRITDVIDV